MKWVVIYMALPMAHLLSAYLWTKDHPELADCPEYYLGAISPDAIHIRDGNDKSNKDYVHLNNWRKPNEEMVIQYWKEHSTPFDLGYGIHVLLDGYWAQKFRADFPEMLNENGRPIPELYYNDTCAADRKLYTRIAETHMLFDMVQKAEAPEGHPYLTQNEFEQWKSATADFYEAPKMKFGESKFITYEYMFDFIQECPKIFSRVYEQAFDAIC